MTPVIGAFAKDLATRFGFRLRAVPWLAVLVLAGAPASAAETIRLAVQKTGTFALELAVIKDRGLDKQADLDLDVSELASPEAGQIALRGGAADIILTDWLWVARERSLGFGLTFYPYSTSIGAVMVPADLKIGDIADLEGKTIAVAGGPLDKSWLMLQALAQRDGLDLKAQSRIAFGTPALLAEKTAQGEADANLNFWNFCVSLEARGFRRLISMEEVEKRLGARDKVAMLGYVFDEKFARTNREALQRFFDVTRQAKEILAQSDSDWERLAPRVGIKSPAQLALYRRSYVAGIPQRTIADEASDARALYQILAKIGGSDLVGPATELPDGTFYQPSPER